MRRQLSDLKTHVRAECQQSATKKDVGALSRRFPSRDFLIRKRPWRSDTDWNKGLAEVPNYRTFDVLPYFCTPDERESDQSAVLTYGFDYGNNQEASPVEDIRNVSDPKLALLSMAPDGDPSESPNAVPSTSSMQDL